VGPITKSELMALASVSPTVAGSKPKKLLDQTRDVLATIRRLLRVERERRRAWVANIGFDRQRHVPSICESVRPKTYEKCRIHVFSGHVTTL
jgi:hypothetical protein